VKRREFITLLGGGVVAWPLATHAQQQRKMLRVGFVGIQPRVVSPAHRRSVSTDAKAA
jgi:hypothetical protein